MGRRVAAALAVSSMIGALVMLTGAAPAGAGGGGCREMSVTDRRVTAVDAKDFCFFPSIVRIAVNQTVVFTNRDEAEHTVSGVGGWGDDLAGQDRAVTVRFPAPGTWPYFCQLHIGMVGVVVVGTGVPTGASATAVPVIVSRAAPETTTTEAPPPTTGSALAANPATSLAASSSDAPRRGPRLAVDLAILVPLVAGAYAVGRIRRPRRSGE